MGREAVLEQLGPEPPTLDREKAEQWARGRRVLGLVWEGRLHYAGFQFGAEGQPRPAMARVLAALDWGAGPWEIAGWLAARDSELGSSPAEALAERPDEVVEAAFRARVS